MMEDSLEVFGHLLNVGGVGDVGLAEMSNDNTPHGSFPFTSSSNLTSSQDLSTKGTTKFVEETPEKNEENKHDEGKVLETDSDDSDTLPDVENINRQMRHTMGDHDR